MASKKEEEAKKRGHLVERGIGGVDSFMGFIQQAYNTELEWPSVQPLYSRIRRSDPEITIVRQIFTALTRQLSLRFELPDDPNDDELKAQEFGNQVLADMEGGSSGFLDTLTSNVPFMGWGWWEVLHGIRTPEWTAEDGWKSEYDDGLIGIRRLAWRDSSSFMSWDINEDTGRLLGMIQSKGMGKGNVTLPLEDSLHITFGDSNCPEGLTPLEAIWRLERIKYGLEVVQGIGFEHASGYLDVVVDETLSPNDKTMIKKAARAIMTAQEGNYATWPKGITGEIKDINFQAATAILAAIKYYGILKLSIYNSQWVALSASTGSGSYSAMQESSSMFMTTYNAMMQGFIKQVDDQVFKRLFKINELAFPGMENRPALAFTPIEKSISLEELGSFIDKLDWLVLGDDDIKAIRERSGFLPVAIPEEESDGVKKGGVFPKSESSFGMYMDKLAITNPKKHKMILERTARK